MGGFCEGYGAEVLKIAELAKLHFSESDLEDFTAQFQHILDYIEKLKGVDIEGVEPTSHAALADVPASRSCAPMRSARRSR